MIKIIGDWYFDLDEYQRILIHQYQKEKREFGTKRRTGEFVTKTEEVGYFHTDEGMLVGLRQILVKEKYDKGKIQTIDQYLAEQRKINAELVEACNVDKR